MSNHLIHSTLAKRQFIAGAVMAVAGGTMAIIGMVISAWSAVAGTQRWARHLDPPAREVAQVKWRQAKAASLAGAGAWRFTGTAPKQQHWDDVPRSATPVGRG